MGYEQIITDVQALSRQELLGEARQWQKTMITPTPAQVAAWDRQTDGELRGHAVRTRAQAGLDAAGRKRVNQELQAGYLDWRGGARMGAWVLRPAS